MKPADSISHPSRRALLRAGLGTAVLLTEPLAAHAAPAGFDKWREHFRGRALANGVSEATWNRGVDRFITTMGVGDGALISRALAMTAKMGRLVVTNIHPMAENSVSVNMMDLTLTQKQIVGTLYGSANPRADIPKLLELAASGQVDLDAIVSNTYPLEAINEGYADMRTGRFLRGVLRYPAAG